MIDYTLDMAGDLYKTAIPGCEKEGCFKDAAELFLKIGEYQGAVLNYPRAEMPEKVAEIKNQELDTLLEEFFKKTRN